jgi:hypothetical protein
MAGQLSLVVLVAAAAVGYALLRAGPVLRDEDSAVRPVEVALDEEMASGAAQRLATALSFPTLASEGAVSSVLGTRCALMAGCPTAPAM